MVLFVYIDVTLCNQLVKLNATLANRFVLFVTELVSPVLDFFS